MCEIKNKGFKMNKEYVKDLLDRGELYDTTILEVEDPDNDLWIFYNLGRDILEDKELTSGIRERGIEFLQLRALPSRKRLMINLESEMLITILKADNYNNPPITEDDRIDVVNNKEFFLLGSLIPPPKEERTGESYGSILFGPALTS